MTDTTSVSGLDRLAASARERVEPVEAENRTKLAAQREHECQAAADQAARDYEICFAMLGKVPQGLEWTGYPRGRDAEELRTRATAYLGAGLFLTHRPYRPTAGSYNRFRVGSFDIAAAGFPDTEHLTEPQTDAHHAADAIAVAEILHLIQARRTGQTGGSKETETR